MIEINADDFTNESNSGGNIILDERKISMFISPHLQQDYFRTGDLERPYLPGWCFDLVIDGYYRSFGFQDKSKCEDYFQKIVVAWWKTDPSSNRNKIDEA